MTAPLTTRSANLFGFGQKTKTGEKCAKRSSYTIPEALAAAYVAGRRSGDTGLFKTWLCSKGLQARGGVLITRLRREYSRAVEENPKPGIKEAAVFIPGAAPLQYFAGKAFGKNMAKKKQKLTTVKINPGTGAFEKCVKAVSASGTARSPRGVCATAGRKKYGKKKFAAMAKAGKKRATAKKSNPRRVWTSKQGSATAEITKPLLGAYKVVIKKGGRVITESFKAMDGAMAWARLKLFEVASENPSKRGKKNPLEAAQKTYEEFHGFPTKEVAQIVEKEHVHSITSEMADLLALVVLDVEGKRQHLIIAPGYRYTGPDSELFEAYKGKGTGEWERIPAVTFQKVISLASSETNGNGQKKLMQLYLKGGDQSVNTSALGLNSRDQHEDMLLGTLVRIWYRTKKAFEMGGKTAQNFFHDFGKQGSDGICPVITYQPRNPSLRVVGGRYYIAPLRRDIGASPGIVG